MEKLRIIRWIIGILLFIELVLYVIHAVYDIFTSPISIILPLLSSALIAASFVVDYFIAKIRKKQSNNSDEQSTNNP
jgi:hypothetical protein